MSSELYQLIQRKNDLKSQDNLNGNNLTHIKTMIPPRPGLCGLWANPILQDNRIRAHIWLQLTCQTLPLRLRTQSFNNQGYSHILHWTPTRRSVEALEVFFSDTLSAEQVLFRNQSICGGSNQMTSMSSPTWGTSSWTPSSTYHPSNTTTSLKSSLCSFPLSESWFLLPPRAVSIVSLRPGN